METITTKEVAAKLSAYLQHDLSLADLVDWAENVMMEGTIEGPHSETVREILARLGVADVKAFGLSWEDCEEFLRRLGYSVQIEVVENSITAD